MKTTGLATRHPLMQYYNINLKTIHLQTKCFELQDAAKVELILKERDQK